jgi:hypothetical protein
VAIAEGAHFRGSVDMQRKAGQNAQATKAPAVVQTPTTVTAVPPPAATSGSAQQRANA